MHRGEQFHFMFDDDFGRGSTPFSHRIAWPMDCSLRLFVLSSSWEGNGNPSMVILALFPLGARSMLISARQWADLGGNRQGSTCACESFDYPSPRGATYASCYHAVTHIRDNRWRNPHPSAGVIYI